MGTKDAPPSILASNDDPLPKWRIILCAAAMCGIQVCYAAQINLGTAELLRLGIHPRAVSLAWLAGPLSGLIVQPLVGYASDHCTASMGRRRPFLIAGAILTSLALLLFANATHVASWTLKGAAEEQLALSIGIVSFFLLDFSIQAIQAPLRALITDVVPKPQRAFANAYVGVFTGLGNFIGGFLTGLELRDFMPWFTTQAQALFSVAVMVLIITVGVCVAVTREAPLTRGYDVEDDDPGAATPLLNTEGESQNGSQEDEGDVAAVGGWYWGVLKEVPRPFWRVFTVQLCTWVGFFTLFVYVNSWVGRNVYLGDGSARGGTLLRKKFERGVMLGGHGNALTALVTLLYSLVLPRLLKRFGIIIVYSFSQLVEAFCLLAAPWIRGLPGVPVSTKLKLETMLDIGLFGIVWATTMGVPWTIIGDALECNPFYARRVGLFTTLFNASQSFPQLLVAFLAPVVLSFSHDDPAYVMFSGGICALIGAVLVVALRVDVVQSQVDQLDGEEESAES